MKALVTGAAGFIGSHLVELLCERGYETTCLVRKGEDTSWLDGNDVTYLYADVTDRRSLETVGAVGFDYIFHLAGILKTEHTVDYFNVNVEGTRNLADVCMENGIPGKRFVYVSSVTAAGPGDDRKLLRESDRCRPVTEYGRSKLAAEKMLLVCADRLPVTILRPALVYGPRNAQGVFSLFKCTARGVMPDLGVGMSNIIYVKDLARAILCAAEHEKAVGEVYFVGSTRAYSYSEISGILSQIMGRRVIKVKIPAFALFVTGVLFQAAAKITRTPPVFDLRRARDLMHRYWMYDTSKMRDELGFIPGYDILDGFRETVQWYRREGWIP